MTTESGGKSEDLDSHVTWAMLENRGCKRDKERSRQSDGEVAHTLYLRTNAKMLTQ
jgi:hypothetical protein